MTEEQIFELAEAIAEEANGIGPTLNQPAAQQRVRELADELCKLAQEEEALAPKDPDAAEMIAEAAEELFSISSESLPSDNLA